MNAAELGDARVDILADILDDLARRGARWLAFLARLEARAPGDEEPAKDEGEGR